MVGLLGKTGDPAATAIAELAVPMVTAFVRGWTGGRGFKADGTMASDLAAVVASAAVRWTANPSQLEHVSAMGPFRAEYRSGFDGFTVHEQVILDGYRVRAR